MLPLFKRREHTGATLPLRLRGLYPIATTAARLKCTSGGVCRSRGKAAEAGPPKDRCFAAGTAAPLCKLMVQVRYCSSSSCIRDHNSPSAAQPTGVDSRWGCVCCKMICPPRGGGRPLCLPVPKPPAHRRPPELPYRMYHVPFVPHRPNRIPLLSTRKTRCNCRS